MKNIDVYTETFKLRLEQFIIGCDSLEESGLWNIEEYGEMDVFYSSDMTCIILRLIASDGRITEREVEYLNKNFGFEYDLPSLVELYESSYDSIGKQFDVNFEKGVDILKEINEKLANEYRTLLALACDIIIASDGIVASAEIAELNRVKSLFE